MIKKLNKWGLFVVLSATAILFSGCSDDFLEEKKDYNRFTGDDVYNDYEGAKGRIDYLYYILLPSSTASIGFDTPSAGVADDYSKSTEEYGGFSDYVNPGIVWDNSTVPDYIYRENKNISPYGRIRECNDIIEGIEGGSLSQEQKEELVGQAYFFRAWCYYRLVKIYGGVPIIDHVQNAMVGESGGSDLVVPRATTKECIDFICGDLAKAAKYLPLNWNSTAAGNYGRVTAGTALALQGRTRLLYASPLFNRADNQDRWEKAYQSNKNALDTLTLGGFGLAYLEAPGANATGWAKMFSDYQSKEAVFVTLYNNVKTGIGTNYNKNNGWENSIRPKNSGGSGGKATTAQMLDVFPMADGKKPIESTTYTYNPQLFFMNRDPRFYRTFAFPGVRWAFSGNPTSKNTSTATTYPYAGSDYVLWSYCWYKDASKQAVTDQTGYAADALGTSNTSIYIRKRTDDLDVNSSAQYTYDTDVSNMFGWSGAPYMEIRYAEVLLNFAEAACGSGHLSEAYDALKLIRQRVGYTAANNYGLDPVIAGDRAKLFSAILYERQIELAYEGKRFDDMRRWMLWDGGVGQGQLKSTWALTGFGGNTCTYLSIEPFNGKRRTGIEIQLAASLGQAEEKDGSDPIVTKKITRPTGLSLKTEFRANPSNVPIDTLANFYSANLYRKTTRVDGTETNYITFRPNYYLIGFRTNMQRMNATLLQTVGWADFNQGNAPGTFDPLAE